MRMRMKAILPDRIARTRGYKDSLVKGAETQEFPASVVFFPADERDIRECVRSRLSEMAKVPSDGASRFGFIMSKRG